jgi:crooked neck
VVKNWLKYAKFEEKNQYISSARRIYERAVEYFGDEYLDESLMVAFAKFEESQREVGCRKVLFFVKKKNMLRFINLVVI